jgi:hypothetical protein
VSIMARFPFEKVTTLSLVTMLSLVTTLRW